MHPIVLAITGASGAPYALRLLEVLLAAERSVFITISPSGQAVLKTELGLEVDLKNFSPAQLRTPHSALRTDPSLPTPDPRLLTSSRLHYCHYQDLMSPIASGSFLTAGMVICPCSGSTLGAVANSIGSNLIHRAAEVHLKERRKLILVPRETPLSLPQIENMQRATHAGAVILPASPGFYHGPTTIDDLVDFVVARICDQLAIPHDLTKRWGGATSN